MTKHHACCHLHVVKVTIVYGVIILKYTIDSRYQNLLPIISPAFSNFKVWCKLSDDILTWISWHLMYHFNSILISFEIKYICTCMLKSCCGWTFQSSPSENHVHLRIKSISYKWQWADNSIKFLMLKFLTLCAT